MPTLIKINGWVRQPETIKYYLKKLLTFRTVKLTLLGLVGLFVGPLVAFFALRPAPADEIHYGVNFSNQYAEQLRLDWHQTYLSILDDLGVKRIRLVAYWDEIEAQRDIYDFSQIKWQLEEAQKRDVEVILVTGRKVLRYPECYEPAWWEALASQTEQEAEVYEFIHRTITELKEYGNIAMWQIENEPFFPFGECAFNIGWQTLKNEIALVHSLDSRPVLTQDSGEGGVWYPTYSLGDYLGISMYRRIWFDFWGLVFGRTIYFQYPLAHWTYKIKANLVHVPMEKIIVTELQAEPWGPRISSDLTVEEKSRTMSRELFIDTLNYAQKSGFTELYFWGAEWWYFEKEVLGEPFYWNTAKAVLN